VQCVTHFCLTDHLAIVLMQDKRSTKQLKTADGAKPGLGAAAPAGGAGTTAGSSSGPTTADVEMKDAHEAAESSTTGAAAAGDATGDQAAGARLSKLCRLASLYRAQAKQPHTVQWW